MRVLVRLLQVVPNAKPQVQHCRRTPAFKGLLKARAGRFVVWVSVACAHSLLVQQPQPIPGFRVVALGRAQVVLLGRDRFLGTPRYAEAGVQEISGAGAGRAVRRVGVGRNAVVVERRLAVGLGIFQYKIVSQ